MTAAPTPESLRLRLSPSPRLAWALAALHGLAAAVVPPLPLPLWLRLGLIAAIAAGGVVSIRRHALLRGADAVLGLTLDGAGQWWLQPRDGVERPARLLGDSLVQPRLLLLRFALGGGWSARRRAVAILPGMADGETLRRLRVRLYGGEGNIHNA